MNRKLTEAKMMTALIRLKMVSKITVLKSEIEYALARQSEMNHKLTETKVLMTALIRLKMRPMFCFSQTTLKF